MNLHPLIVAQRLSIVAGVAVASACGLAWGPLAGLAAAVGTILAVANLWAIRMLALGAVARSEDEGLPARAAAGLSAALLGKMVLLFTLVWAVIRLGALPVLPLGLGFMVLVFGLVVAGLNRPHTDRQGAL